MKKYFIVIICLFVMLSAIDLRKVKANYDSLSTINLEKETAIINPTLQFVSVYMCDFSTKTIGMVANLTNASRNIWYNGDLNTSLLNSNGTIKKTSGVATTYIQDNLQDKYIAHGGELESRRSWYSNTSYNETIHFTKDIKHNQLVKSNPYLDYKLYLNKEDIKIENGLYPVYSGYSKYTATIEKVYKLKDTKVTDLGLGSLMTARAMGYNKSGITMNGNVFPRYSLNFYSSYYLENLGFVRDLTGGTIAQIKSNEPFGENTKFITLVNSKNVEYNYYNDYSRTNYAININLLPQESIFKGKLTNEHTETTNIKRMFPKSELIYDITDKNKPEYDNYKYSFKYGAFLSDYNKAVGAKTTEEINSLTKKGIKMNDLPHLSELDSLKNTTCEEGSVILTVNTVKNVFIDRTYVLDPDGPEIVRIEDDEDKIKVVINPEDITDKEKGIDDDLKGDDGEDLLDQNLQVKTGLDIKITNIPENGNVIIGDSYFVPQVQISNNGKASILPLDIQVNQSNQYIEGLWDIYNQTDTTTDLLIYKVEDKSKTFDKSMLDFKGEALIDGLKLMAKINNLSKTSDLSNLKIETSGEYLIAVNSTDKSDEDKTKTILQPLNLTFNDNIGALPVVNNLLFNINDKLIRLNKLQSSLPISKPTLPAYNSLKIPSITNSKGETLIGNINGEFALVGSDLKVKHKETSLTSLNSVSILGEDFLIATNDGLFIFDGNTYVLTKLDSELSVITRDIKTSGDYIIVTHGNELSLVNIDKTQSKALKGISYSNPSELDKVEDLGKFIILTEKDSGKIKIISKN